MKAIEQLDYAVQGVLTIESADVTIQMKAVEYFFPMDNFRTF